MKKNNKFLSILFIFVLLFVSCEDEEVTLNEVSHRVIVTSEMNFENKVIVGGDIDFGDISRGVESRTWTFPENNSNIIGEEGNTSSKNVIKAVFSKAGVYDVNLNQIFKDNVFPEEGSTVPSDTKELDTTIVVTVLDSIKSNLRAYRINPDGSTGAEIDLSEGAENELEASNSIRLTYSAIGEPQNVSWKSIGGKPNAIFIEDDSEVDMRFNRLGSWDIEYIASRFRPTDADTLTFENVIKVIPSTAPVTLDRVAERDDNVILEFSREMDAATVNSSDFAVRIENNNGTPILINPTISSATVDKDEATIIVLELDGVEIYNDDEVYISYTPGALRTVDEVESEAITDALLTEFDPLTNIYPDTDFDYGLEIWTPDNFKYKGWGAPWDKYSLSSDAATVRSGASSLKVTLEPNGGMIVEPVTGLGGDLVTFTIKAGTKYEFGYWMYIESDLSAVPTGTQSPDIQVYPSDWGGPNLVPTTFNSSLPTGEWVYYSQEFDNSGGGDRNISWFLRGFNEHHSNEIVFYFDDFFLAVIPERP